MLPDLNSFIPKRSLLPRAALATAVAALLVSFRPALLRADAGGHQSLTDAMAQAAHDTSAGAPAADQIKQTGEFDLALPLPDQADIPRLRSALYARYGKQVPSNDMRDAWPAVKDQACDFYVPQSYVPGQKPYALIVWIAQADKAAVIGKWQQALDDRNAIWLGLGDLPSSMPSSWRTFVAMNMARLAAGRLTLDPQRIYVFGDGKGGVTAAQTALIAPDVFNGGLFIGEGDFYRSPGFSGGFAPAVNLQIVAQCRANSRFVFEIGKQAPPGQGFSVRESFRQANFQYFTFFQGEGSGSPTGDEFGKILDDLDAPLLAAAEQQYKSAQNFEKSHQLGDALAGYTAAAAHGQHKPFVADAEQKAAALRQQYDDSVKKIETLIDARKFNDAIEAIQHLQAAWGAMAKAKSTGLMHQIAAARAAR